MLGLGLGLGLGKGSGGAAPYTGFVASRGEICEYGGGAGSWDKSMSRTKHYATDAITSLQLVFANWFFDGVEQASGHTATHTASIEYPAGVFAQVLFGGAAAGTIASGGTLVSDATAVAIPNGAAFWVRSYRTTAGGGMLFQSYVSSVPADTNSYDFGLAITDMTMGGTVGGAGSNYASPPTAIIGTTTKATCFIIGDSRTWGTGDTAAETNTGRFGVLGAFKDIGHSGCPVFGKDTTHYGNGGAVTRRLTISQYASHLYNGLGSNDIVARGISAAQLATDLQTVRTAFGGKPMIVVTVDPRTTGTWTDLPGQTTTGNDGVRLTHNSNIRANPEWAAGYFDIASITESGGASAPISKWVPNYTSDGTHANNTGYVAIRGGGVIDLAKFAR